MTGDKERPQAARKARAWVLLECLLATALTLYLAVRFERPSVWLLVPIVLLVANRRRAEDYGLDLRFTPPPFRVHLALGAAVLGLYAAGHVAVEWLLWDARFSPRLPHELVWLALYQLLVVALPEEVFFRGYLQTSLNRVFPRRRVLFGASAGAALVLQAAVFALCHLATGDWTRLRVFFFGLLAGWLRERSGSVAAPVAYHAVANLWYAFLVASLS
jgi:uncharacterized protein